ncbi:MAG TPA: hypothetical protein DDW85_15665 [Porphyromonadaceae bacterium]|nr:hypothetical protein [Porphyromonadaceae bacterium]
MKKLLLFAMIGVSLILTSCLGETDTQFSGMPLSYITRTEGGTVFARTIDGLAITSSSIKNLTPGTFVVITYSWNEKTNTVTEDNIYDVTVTNIDGPIEQSSIAHNAAPVQTPKIPLKDFQPFLYNSNIYNAGEYFDYHIFYSYQTDESDKGQLKFYKSEETDISDNKLVIDARWEASAFGKDSEKGASGAVKIKSIMDEFLAGSSSTEYKTLQVTFQYFEKGNDGKITLKKSQPYSMVISKEKQ